jgi:tetratricopeptide (TPR) repeat protein
VLALAAALAGRAADAAPLKSDAEIKTLMGAGRWDEAIAAARERVAAAPQEAESHVLLGTSLFLKARSTPPPASGPAITAAEADAIAKELEAAIAIAPDRKDVYLGLIDVETAAGRDDRTLEQVKRCAAQFPSDPKAAASLIEYGLERQSRQDPLAGPILQAVYQAYTKVPPVVIAYAHYVMSTGELDQATEMLRIATTQVPNNVDLLEALGDALGYKLDFGGAAKVYGSASALDTTRRGVRLKWAAALHTTDPKSAMVLVEPLRTEAKPAAGAPTVQLKEGGLQGPSRITRCASMLWKVLSQSAPSGLEIHNMAKTFMQSGFGPQALAETQVALARNHNMVEVWLLRAEVYTRAGLDNQALEALDKADEVFDALDPAARPAYSHDEVLAARAASQSRLGHNADALASYARMSDSGRYTYQMAIVNEKLGHIEEARALLQKVAVTGLVPAEVEAAKARLETETYRKKP